VIALYSIDPASHQLTSVSGSPFPASGAGVDAVFDPSGTFVIVAQDNGIGVYQVSSSSITEVPGSPFSGGTSFSRLTVAPSGGFVIGLSQQSQQAFVFTLNSSTGALTVAPGSPLSSTTPSDLAIVQH
jgi:6-phosphogluconolactonase (cycloisomerase 2 family)